MPKVTYPESPSKMFMHALRSACMGSGTNELECQCGRVHLCPDSEYAENPEIYKEYCESELAARPESTILHYGYDEIRGYHFAGSVFVEDCPCNTLTKYENFIWGERDLIRRFLKDRIDDEFRIANEEKTLNKLAGIDDNINGRGAWI